MHHTYLKFFFICSSRQPYLILFYSDWCFTCLRIEPIWTRIVEELEPVGFGIATVHTEHEKEVCYAFDCSYEFFSSNNF